MKRSTLVKLAFMFVAMFVFAQTYAQTHNGTDVNGTGTTAFATAGETWMIEGSTIPVFALPDSYYHPNYNGTTVFTLTDGFTWTWAVTAGTAANINFSQNNAQDNYVQITAAATSAGDYTINVLEKAPAAYGGCDDGVGENLTLHVVAQPAFSFGAADVTVNSCAAGAGLPATIDATITGGWQQYRLAWNLEIATLNSSLAKDFYYDDENGTNPTAGQKYAVNHTTTTFQSVAASGATDLMTVGAFNTIGGKTTVYTYTLVSINDQASRFGNFIALNGNATVPANFTYYAAPAAGDSYIVTVYPAPNTGPIYHVPATWAN